MRRRLGILAISLAVLGLSAGAASAQDSSPDGDEADITTAGSDAGDPWFRYDDQLMMLRYWLVALDGEAPECASPDGDGPGTSASPGAPQACHEVSVQGPNGQVTHGSVVSAFVSDLKVNDYDRETFGPKGHWVRDIARSDLGKNDVGDSEATEFDGDDQKVPRRTPGTATTRSRSGTTGATEHRPVLPPSRP